MESEATIRVAKELHDFYKGTDLEFTVAFQEQDYRVVKTLIVGPHGTPYEFGFFEFTFKFSKDYPRKPPTVLATTTNGGRCRFNPNIYANGKVCLSILGTWRGNKNEEWSSAQGIWSILVSIQSLMSADPYENEPGFENAKTKDDQAKKKAYVQKIRHETLRLSVIQPLEESLNIGADGVALPSATEDADADSLDEEVAWEPFKDFCKSRFLWYYDSYLAAAQRGKLECPDGTVFTKMPFEGAGNIMDGKFNYSELERRLKNIKKALDAETESWAVEGLKYLEEDATIAKSLQVQAIGLQSSLGANHVEMEKKNPFVWNLHYFGGYMSCLDEGNFTVRVCFSPRFPNEQPRVRLLHPKNAPRLHHKRVASDWTLCYLMPKLKQSDVKTHLLSIIKALEEEESCDPREVINLEAFESLWGKNDNGAAYKKKLRASVKPFRPPRDPDL